MSYLSFHFRALLAMCTLVLGLAYSSSAQAALEIPSQFESKNSATVLGLDQDPDLLDPEAVVTAEMLRSAWAKLIRKYHPDLYQDPEKFSDQDRKNVELIAKKINSAYEALTGYITFDVNFNPRRKGPFIKAKASKATGAADFAGNAYTNLASTDLVPGSRHAGQSILGTQFEFLRNYPDLEQAVLPLQGWAINQDQRIDAVMIIIPKIFPYIEIRYIAKESNDSGIQSVGSIYGIYKKQHHEGIGRSVDAIVLPNHHYYADIIQTGQPLNKLEATKIEYGKGTYLLKAKKGAVLSYIEFNRTGFTSGVGRALSATYDESQGNEHLSDSCALYLSNP